MMNPSANLMVLRIYEILLMHHDSIFETLTASTALVQTVAQRDPELWKVYDKIHLANIAASVKQHNEWRALIESTIRALKEHPDS